MTKWTEEMNESFEIWKNNKDDQFGKLVRAWWIDDGEEGRYIQECDGYKTVTVPEPSHTGSIEKLALNYESLTESNPIFEDYFDNDCIVVYTDALVYDHPEKGILVVVTKYSKGDHAEAAIMSETEFAQYCNNKGYKNPFLNLNKNKSL